MKLKTSLTMALAGTALAFAANSAEARNLNYSVGLAPGSSVSVAVGDYADHVAELSGGDVEIKVYPLELVSLPEMGPGIRDGLTDMGFMAAPYYQAEFAHTNFLAEQSMLMTLLEPSGTEGIAYAGAITEYITTRCPECLSEYKAQNHVYLGHISTTPYVMLCGPEVRTIADLKGKRLRAGSAAYKRFAEHFGAVGVQLPASEAYESLSQGVLDCAMLSAGDLTNYRLKEVVKSITLRLPGNVYGGTVAGNINRDVWKSLTDDQRRVLLQAGARLAADITLGYQKLQDADLAEFAAAGGQVVEPDAELIAAHRAWVVDDQKVIAEIFANNFGVTRAAEIQAEFQPILEKWIGLVASAETLDDVTKVYWDEVYSKLDPTTYGMD